MKYGLHHQLPGALFGWWAVAMADIVFKLRCADCTILTVAGLSMCCSQILETCLGCCYDNKPLLCFLGFQSSAQCAFSSMSLLKLQLARAVMHGRWEQLRQGCMCRWTALSVLPCWPWCGTPTWLPAQLSQVRMAYADHRCCRQHPVCWAERSASLPAHAAAAD